MQYFDAECNAKVTITCGGKPLEGPYLPPQLLLEELGRFYAKHYSTSDVGDFDDERKGKEGK